MDSNELSRRRFLQSSGGSLGFAWLAANWPQIVAAAEHAHAASAADGGDRARLVHRVECNPIRLPSVSSASTT